ncbi:MAG: Cysteine-rich secretory protein family protein [Syntrophorhabdus sp. PtaB.Bin006]|nr:MAG: Cysteine-rich secretory protein family protein [Syntrophorhabdus sp. PtaB.Bin006]
MRICCFAVIIIFSMVACNIVTLNGGTEGSTRGIVLKQAEASADTSRATAQRPSGRRSGSTTTRSGTGGPSSGSRLTGEEIHTLLALHNRVREDVGVGPLGWSKNLAVYAQQWADHLAATSCRMEHRPRSGKWGQQHGENLLIGTVGYHGVADAVEAWENEKTYYHGQALNASNWHASGHYTQVVWRNTKEIGCAKAECGGRVIVVCNYDPPGNVMGQRPF